MLSDFAVRLVTAQAIRGRTWAEARVMNQPVDPIKAIADNEQTFTPAMAVFSGEATHKVTGQDLSGFEQSKSTLTIAAYCPQSARVTLDGREIEVQGNGPLAAFVLDTLLYQARMALLAPDNPWGRLWPMFVTSIESVEITPPFLDIGQGDVRVFLRVMTIDYSPLRDPVTGRAMTASWRALHDQMLEDPAVRPLAPMLKTAIESPAITPDWQFAMMQLGLSDVSATNTGIMPLEPTGDQMDQVGTYETDPEDDGEIVVPNTDEGAV